MGFLGFNAGIPFREWNLEDTSFLEVIAGIIADALLKVMAEGVETEPQLRFFSQKMCDEVQGYYYYHPMPPERIEDILRGNRRLPASGV